jgi:hypothetical protein
MIWARIGRRGGGPVVEFRVDVDGMTGLYHQVRRAAEDARSTLGFVRQHCDLDLSDTGVLGEFLGPHEAAYEMVTGYLDATDQLATFAQRQIGDLQAAFRRTDEHARQAFDKLLSINPFHETPGQIVATRYPGLATPHQPFSDAVRPLECLNWSPVPDPPEHFDFRLYADWLSPSAWMRLGTQKVLGVDPFQYWLQLLGSGDWSKYQRVAITWSQVALVCDAIATNLVRAAQDIAGVWTGNAAFQCQCFLTDLARGVRGLADGCRFYCARYADATTAAREAYAALDPVFSQLFDAVLIAMVSAGIGMAGIETGVVAVGGFAVAGFYALKAWDCYEEISKVIDRFDVLVHGYGLAVAAYNEGKSWTMPQVNLTPFPAIR